MAQDANAKETTKLIELLIGIAIRCENKRECIRADVAINFVSALCRSYSPFCGLIPEGIQNIMALPKETQQYLMAVINEVRIDSIRLELDSFVLFLTSLRHS